MKFRNPWIDPRVVQVRSAAAQAYLLQHGWKTLPPGQASLLTFEKLSESNGDQLAVRVPLLEQARDYPQRVIELITDLAHIEDRYAVEILNDIFNLNATAVAANGPTVATEPATR
jgi:hypothetical protein